MYNKFYDNKKPTIVIAQHYDKKITVEFDHSDTDLNEIMDAFETLVIGMGFAKNSFRQWVKDTAEEYREEDGDNEIDNYVNTLSDEKINQALAEHNSYEDENDYDDYGQLIEPNDVLKMAAEQYKKKKKK